MMQWSFHLLIFFSASMIYKDIGNIYIDIDS